MQVAIASNHAADFWDLPVTVQANLIAAFRVKGLIDAYEAKMKNDEAERERKRRPPSRGR